jgi:hypothetical protein
MNLEKLHAALFNDWAIENKESVESRKAVKEEGFNVPEFTQGHNAIHKSIRHHGGNIALVVVGLSWLQYCQQVKYQTTTN